MPKRQTIVVTRGVLWGSIVVAIVALICVRLGFWQLQRLEQRRARNDATRVRMQEAPTQLTALSQDSGGMIFRRVRLTGEYDDAHTIIIAGRSLRGVPGVHVLTPLRVGGAAVLVNRGWMPSADAARIEVDSIREPGPRSLEALITPFPEDFGRAPPADGFHRVWFQMNGARLRRQFPYPVLPVIAQILPHPGQPLYPIRLKPPEMDEGPHFGYAIQWFSFAIIAIVGWTALLLRRNRME
jgi:surfeit locus 1 family protein